MEISQIQGSYRCFEEVINKTACSQCQTPLKSRWLTQTEQEKLIFNDPKLEPGFRNGSQLSQVEVYYCPDCAWQHPSLLCKDKFVDIPLTEQKLKYQKERDLIEKIAAVLLPNQSIKIRLIKSSKGQQTATNLLNHPQKGKSVYCICFSVERLVQAEKTRSGLFCDVVAHELAHASPEVWKNSQHNPSKYYFNCSCGLSYHPGEGHDKIWHDKYDEFRERIKNEKLAGDSGYTAYGIDFQHSKKEEVTTIQENRLQNWKVILIVGGVFFTLILLSLVYFLTKRQKDK